MEEEKNSEIKERMLDYMIALLQDAHDFSWSVAKARPQYQGKTQPNGGKNLQ